MRHELPEYLRLHVAEDLEWSPESDHDVELDCLCRAFSMATGWQLDHHCQSPSSLALWSTQLVGVRSDTPVTVELSGPMHDDLPDESLSAAPAVRSLAEELVKLVDRLHRTERALWEREAELAAAVPVVARPDDESAKLAVRLEDILRGGVELVDGAAAALYLLDDATSQLKMRSQWGLPRGRFTDPPRLLRSAMGDLEALAGHAVVLEDTSALPHWNPPERFPAAACVPVSTSTVPLGTLWVFADTKRDFTERQVHLLEIVAGRLAVELEREILLREHLARKCDNHLEEAVAWQRESLPQQSPDLPGWDVAGAVAYENSLNSEFYHWSVDDSGRLRSALWSVFGNGLPASLTAAQLSGIFSPSDGMAESSVQLHRANRLLWSGSAGGRLATAWCGELDPSSGRLTAHAAGDLYAYIIRPHGWELLTSPGAMLGQDELISDRFSTEQWLLPGDALLVIAGQRRYGTCREADGSSESNQLAETLLRHSHLTSSELLRLLRTQWNASDSQWFAPPAMLVARFLDP